MKPISPIPVHYNPLFGIFLLLGGVFVLGTGLMLGKGMLMVVGAMNLAVGLGITTQPMFVVHGNKVELKNLLGMTLKTREFDSLAELEIRGKKLFRKGEPKALCSAGVGKSSDWAKVVAAVEGAVPGDATA